MNSDPISESTPKRRKLDNGTHTKRTYDSDNDSGDELFEDFSETIATVPLPSSQRPGPMLPFAQVMSELQSSESNKHVTQPTQPLSSPRHPGSSPSVQVARSSPRPTSPSPRPQPSHPFSRFGSVASAMAPPGTTFRRPMGIQNPPPQHIIDLSLEDPPVEHSSDEDGDSMQASIKPTEFTKGSRPRDSSPGLVQESPKNSTAKFQALTSQYAYNTDRPAKRSSDDMASSYGGAARRVKPPQQPRQTGPARAQPVVDLTLDDVVDLSVRKKIERMQLVCPTKPIRALSKALGDNNNNFEDALNSIFQQDDDPPDLGDGLASSDIESNAHKEAARPMMKKSAAKQELKAPLRTIHEKYSSQAPSTAKQELKAPLRSIHEKYSSTPAKPTLPKSSSPAEPFAPQPRRRLVQGRKNAKTRSPSPEVQTTSRPKAKTLVAIDSDSDGDSGVGSSDEDDRLNDANQRLLKFLNACSVQELADLANEKEATASLILSHRPFKSFDAIRTIFDAQPTKSGKKSAKRPIGDRVLDVCEEMWLGYEAVDQIVEKCEKLGKPIADTMKRWGLDLLTASRDGEMSFTKIEDAHDSGIGTPTSSVVDEDIVSPAKSGKKSGSIKQPAMMSPDNVVMKDYQLFGLNWLNLLWSKRLSCILADDMGLGKTCQVIAFLAHLRETGVPGTHLVIVPGSTLENWIRECQRFCPGLKVEPYYGSMAEREHQRMDIENALDTIDVVVTTYDTAVGEKGDNKFLRRVVKPVVCVFDEGHVLKNNKSKRHQQLMRIPAQFRLLLTGTPLQNNLQELASLLGFILPDVFEEKRQNLEAIFKYKASTRDDDHAALLSAQRIKRARSMMTPFILRRKKQQVLRDIPAKHRRVEYCDMVPVQQDFYNEKLQVAAQARLDTENGKTSGKATSHMMALRLAALHPLLSRRIYTDEKLRKLQDILINNPASEYRENREDLVWKLLAEDIKGGDYGLHQFLQERADYMPSKYILDKAEWMDSGKVHKLKELLSTFIANGDRVLLFSQFTSMMNILEAVFSELDIKYQRLDGDTPMAARQDLIDQFTNDESIPVFMLSTKAGGAGINLACANKVIIFDSSFNPQDDIQAENRAHRVGQTREVEVVRLVTRGTIEEQIHALGESKLALDDMVAGDSEASKQGEKSVEKMLMEQLDQKQRLEKSAAKNEDVKDEFRKGLRSAGLDVSED